MLIPSSSLLIPLSFCHPSLHIYDGHQSSSICTTSTFTSISTTTITRRTTTITDQYSSGKGLRNYINNSRRDFNCLKSKEDNEDDDNDDNEISFSKDINIDNIDTEDDDLLDFRPSEWEIFTNLLGLGPVSYFGIFLALFFIT